ncbi:MAG: tetratricopeptide repeat protein [Bacteroidota bacterium]
MKRLIILIILGLIATEISAQPKANFTTPTSLFNDDLDSLLRGKRKIFVEPFVNQDPGYFNIEMQEHIHTQVIQNLRSSNFLRAKNQYSQYSHTDRWEIVHSKDEAEFYVSGTYHTLPVVTRDKTEEFTQQKVIMYETHALAWGYDRERVSPAFDAIVYAENGFTVPYVVRKFQYKNEVEAFVTMAVKDMDGNVLFEDSVSKKLVHALPEAIGRPYVFPDDKTIPALEKELYTELARIAVWNLMPQTKNYNMNLVEVRPSERSIRRELNRIDYENAEQIAEAIRLYKKVYEQENSKDAALNISRLLFVLGYFADAQEWDVLAGSPDEIVTAGMERYIYLREKSGKPLREKRFVFDF